MRTCAASFGWARYLPLLLALGCDDSPGSGAPGSGAAPGAGGTGTGGTGTGGAAAGSGGTAGTGNAVETAITVLGGAPVPIPATARGLNYWMWAPAFGDPVAGSEAEVAPLEPGFLRAGGHNNDSNDPNPFNEAEIDDFVAYSRAVGAEPLIQVPLLADEAGALPTVDTAVRMVTHANVTRAHGVRYFSIGNEPDLYPDQEPGFETYTAADYCATVEQFVPAMRAVDPNIRLVGPDLSWKYQAAPNDWLTPILAGCGQHFDIIAVHRYRIDPAQATIARAAGEAAAFRAEIAALRAKIEAAGLGDRPLAITESNLTWNGDPAISTMEASPGTLPAGLWAADAFGVALEQGLWTLAYWSIVEGWTLGFMTEQRVKRPSFHALELYAEHFGASSVQAMSSSPSVHAYASRSAADDGTSVVVVNWSNDTQRLSIDVTELHGGVPAASVEVPPMSMSAVEIPDAGPVRAWTYSEAERAAGAGLRALD